MSTNLSKKNYQDSEIDETDRYCKNLKERDAISLKEFCLRMGVGRTRCYQEINIGRLMTVKSGARRLIPISECKAWLDRLANDGGDK